MQHTGTQTIQTTRITLRPFRLEDAQDVFRNWASDPQVTEFLRWDPHVDVAASSEVVRQWVEGYQKPDHYQWAMELDGQVIGSIGAFEISAWENCEVGYCMGAVWWGKGLMSEALTAVLEHLLCGVGLHRVWAIHDVRNPGSGRVMEKAGMIREGVMREHAKRRDGTWGDMICYGATRADFRRARRR